MSAKNKFQNGQVALGMVFFLLAIVFIFASTMSSGILARAAAVHKAGDSAHLTSVKDSVRNMLSNSAICTKLLQTQPVQAAGSEKEVSLGFAEMPMPLFAKGRELLPKFFLSSLKLRTLSKATEGRMRSALVFAFGDGSSFELPLAASLRIDSNGEHVSECHLAREVGTLAGRSCPDGQAMSGFDREHGTIQCQPLQVATYPVCPDGVLLSDSEGHLSCGAKPNTGYTSGI